jgi:hypothetical protein
MNPELQRIGERLRDPACEALRLSFGLACARRVRHLLEDPRADACLAVLERFVAGTARRSELSRAATEIAAIALAHRGSNSIDGAAHAAVSATYATANALAGRALDAAGYAAYAAVYAYGGYAVGDPTAYEAEFAWQLDTYRDLAAAGGATAAQCHAPAPRAASRAP